MAGLLIEDKLTRFLASAAARTFQWGQHDCELWLADWVALARGIPDPAAHLRGKYRDRETCRQVAGRILCRPVFAIARVVGLPRTATPSRGDIGLIKAGPIVGAIRGRAAWWVLARGAGLMMVPADKAIAWSVLPCR